MTKDDDVRRRGVFKLADYLHFDAADPKALARLPRSQDLFGDDLLSGETMRRIECR